MADVVQTETFSAKLFPFNRYQREASAAVPWGQAVIDQAFEAVGTGVGDTATLAIDLVLPMNYCCLLRSIHLSAYDAQSIYWRTGVLGMAYQLPGGPYKDSMAALPETDFLWWPFPCADGVLNVRNRSSVSNSMKTWSLSEISAGTDTGSGGGPGSDNPMNIPMWISPGYPGSNVVIYLDNNQASTSNIDFRFNAVFDIYDQQQAFAPEVMASPRRLAT
jgi:hypothetical protein